MPNSLWLFMPLLLGGCAAPLDAVPAQLAHGEFSLARVTSTTVAAPTAAPSELPVVVVQGGPGAPPVATAPSPAPASAAPVTAGSGGGGSGGGGSTSTPPPDSYFMAADGRALPAAAGDEVAIPAGLTGPLSYTAPGRVPSTLVLPAAGGPTSTHPSSTSLEDPSTISTALSGSLAPAEAGVALRFVAADRSTFVSTTSDAGAGFALDVPVWARTQGLVIAEATDGRLAFRAATLAPGQGATLQPLQLAAPSGSQPAPPAPPADLTITNAELRLADAGGSGVALPVLARAGATLPAYAIADAHWQVVYRAANLDSTRASELCGPPGALPAFLVPPDLSALPATLRPGSHLSWPDVGAPLYTLRLTRQGQPVPALWEGATGTPAIDLPAGLALAGETLELHVDAWDAHGVDLYSVAELRALRLPADPLAAVGRHAAALRTLAGG